MTRTLTRELARAIAMDRATERMRLDGRHEWNEDDYNLAVEEFDRLWPIEKDKELQDTAASA